MAIRLQELADRLGVELRGDGERYVQRVETLKRADDVSLCFFGDRKYQAELRATGAAAVILAEPYVPLCPVTALVSANPYLTYARAVRLLHPEPAVTGGRHPSAVVAQSAQVDPSAWIGATAVVETSAEIGPRVFVGPGSIVGSGCRIDEDSRLVARVTLCAGTRVGKRVLIQPGAVIGREGFGFAKDGECWVRIPQLGGVRLGDDVEIGANTTVDRGALEDTLIADGAKLDNLIQIGHNCHIGENTALAACSGISGSTKIGRNCTIAGAVGMAGHLTIGDDVHFTGMAMVTRSFTEPGRYSSGIPAMPSAQWQRSIARFRHLDEFARRLKDLEEKLDQTNTELQQKPE
ncbi:UDP-3-O-(3-hydroxymyristoyl)glucosamine N-acyltransferase [Candidatus Thiosymbion oneisti]|uniref:UDP-3-O-(3-hydroxymyristoyl)glucosamine N-acyltransferase n=1 Tax=Candidatus Thiosymbion oneisti TaxID=589554 RepID=UPI000A5BCBC5|nr:UDP-3-O-(3-hydroxymyristoyl)glucosamine N-acyltransferase [Candidatus Thiosymbion oneisti]